MQNLNERNTNIYELDPIQVDTLATISRQSYGNYTNIVRDFLSMEYDISIPWPSQRLSSRSNLEPDTNSLLKNRDDFFTISPNPSNRCFTIKSNLKSNLPLTINVYNFIGILVESNKQYLLGDICIPNEKPGLYLVVILYDNELKVESHKLIIN